MATQVLLSVGMRHDPELRAAIEDFTTRLSRGITTEWHLVKPSGADENVARRTESAAVLTFIQSSDFVVLLDERGQELSSEAFAAKYDSFLATSRRLVFVIGGAYGVDERLVRRADFTWALSQLVFPHQIVRLLLAEQLYRARMITKNHPYHHQ